MSVNHGPYRGQNQWALVLGGSSGIGLASARSLATLGLNLCVVHRDRRGAMPAIDAAFEEIRSQNDVKLIAMNANALDSEGRTKVLTDLADQLNGGTIKTMLHSIALGNLKPVAPIVKSNADTIQKLASELKCDSSVLSKAIDQLFAEGQFALADLATPANYEAGGYVTEEDMSLTIYNMGTSLLTWVQEVHNRKMFAADARIIGLTSEGNEIAWRGYAAVSAAKVALEAVSRSIAREFAPYGLRCNILQPGVTETKALNLIPGSNHLKASALRRNPCGRLTTPEDVAGVVSILSRPEAQWINGSIIRVDGGEHISG